MPVVHPATPATDIANLMIAEDMGRICVVDPQSGALIGIIARRNLLSARAGKLREERERGAHEKRLAWKRTDPNRTEERAGGKACGRTSETRGLNDSRIKKKNRE